MNRNVKIAKELVRLAKSLVATYDEETGRKMEAYLDKIEEHDVSERLAKHNWQLYGFAVEGRGGYEYGRSWSVEPIPEGERFEDRETGDWDDIKAEFEDDFTSIDNGPKVFYACDEYGPSGYMVLGGIEEIEEIG